jgi:glutamyl-tRNA synthetase
MKDLSKQIKAYALQNVIEYGKAQVGKILPKLFQHGLDKDEINEVMPLIKEAVDKVNSLSVDERNNYFEKYKEFLKEKEVFEKKLAELNYVKGRKTVFRLAPYPSGALHIGNAKTYVLNALYAEKYKGSVILVMDDTIGSEKKQLVKESYEMIEDAFKWLGIKYKKVVYKSDRLKIYYKYAEELIKKNKAYVCHCTQEEFKEIKENKKECSCRQFPFGLQLARWKEMFNIKEGHAVLRIKTGMQNNNPAFRDRVLFKISDRKHVRVGLKYRVWPTLEMSWAVDDHLLGITHIIRGNDLQIETDMEKFIWDIFRWKHPEVIHTGLIKIEGLGAKISKSKAQEEVLSGEFIGWDDPRTWSIQSLERRGITPEAVRGFIESIGLNKQDITVPIETLYSINRKILDEKSDRYSFIANPIKINVKNNEIKEIEVLFHPKKKEIRKIKLGKDIFVNGKDFDELKGKEVRLSHLFNIKMDVNADIEGMENKKIQRINWVSDNVKARVLMYNGEWISGIADSGVTELKVGEVIQFERFGFVRFDGKKNGVFEFWFGHG